MAAIGLSTIVQNTVSGATSMSALPKQSEGVELTTVVNDVYRDKMAATTIETNEPGGLIEPRVIEEMVNTVITKSFKDEVFAAYQAKIGNSSGKTLAQIENEERAAVALNAMPLTIRDFCPWNTWEVDTMGETWMYYPVGISLEIRAKWIIDKTTGKRYLNDKNWITRLKCALLVVGNFFAHSYMIIGPIFMCFLRLITCYHLYKFEEENITTAERVLNCGLNLLKLLMLPLVPVFLELAALYGLFCPNEGRKLYSSFEKFAYGRSLLAPCFQPNPEGHAFGGDINKPNQF
jgi:hypothetical protein